MHPSIRAHRILKRLAGYRNWTGEEVPPNHKGKLGDLIGSYSPETGDGSEAIWIFSEGLCWIAEGVVAQVAYKDIESVELGDEKNSRNLRLRLNSGEQHLLSVPGGTGPFHDSLEILRFLDRVLADLGRADPA